jgi:hypothetical protein
MTEILYKIKHYTIIDILVMLILVNYTQNMQSEQREKMYV